MTDEELEIMRCKQLFAQLSEYIDGHLPEEICREIQMHLSDCPPCLAFLRTLQETVDICQQLPQKPLTEETRRELKGFLQSGLDRLKRP